MSDNVTPPWDVPPHWTVTTMGDVCQVVGGSTPKAKEPTYWGGDIQWLGVSDLTGYTDKWIAGGARSLTQAGYDACSTTLMERGAVLFSSRAPIGYVAIASGPICTSQGFKSFVPPDEVDPEFLYWYLRALTPFARGRASGTTFPELSTKAARALPLVIPPPDEQHAIVAAIEDALARLDAIEGELAETRSLSGAFDRSLIRQALAGGEWPSRALASVTTLFTDGDWVLKEDLRTGRDVRLIQLGDIGVGLFKDKSDKWISSARAAEMGVTYLNHGDVLISRMAEPLARACQLPPLDAPAITAVDVTIARVDPAKCLPEYLVMALNNIDFRLAAERVASGTTRLRITRKKLETLTIPLPPLETQQAIVSEVHEQQRMVGEIDEAARGIEAALASVRASVLHRAFTGQLVAPRASGELAVARAAEVAA